MAATLIQVSHACGASAARCREIALSAGFSDEDMIAWADLALQPQRCARVFSGRCSNASATYAVCLDKIVLSPWRLPDCINGDTWGLIIDLENQDGRSEADQIAHVGRLTATAQASGLRIGFFLNALNGELSRRFSGLTADALARLQEASDMLWLALGSKKPERSGSVYEQWSNQLGEFGDGRGGRKLDFSKLGVNFELGVAPAGATVQDARDAHAIITDNALGGGVWIWRNGAKLGPRADETTNEKLRALYLG